MLKEFAIFLLILFSGCLSENSSTGYLEGRITIGPICPVETDPPQLECMPTEETYKAHPLNVVVYKPMDRFEIAQFYGDANGNYRIKLPSGTYKIEEASSLRTYQSDYVTIKENETTRLDIDIDTGIR